MLVTAHRCRHARVEVRRCNTVHAESIKDKGRTEGFVREMVEGDEGAPGLAKETLPTNMLCTTVLIML